MPKETFFNLPEEKRALICEVAVDEFATHSFAQASINRIVTQAGIAKGSFYQYFENKTDLFLYLLQRIAEEKLSYLAPMLSNPERHDFFSLLRELYRSGVRFALERPRYAEISKRLMASKGTPIYDEVMGHNLPSGLEFFEALLKEGIAQGEVRADIDAGMLAYIATAMNALVVEYYLEHVGADYDEEMIETLDTFLDFLRNGIGRRDEAGPAGEGQWTPATAAVERR